MAFLSADMLTGSRTKNHFVSRRSMQALILTARALVFTAYGVRETMVSAAESDHDGRGNGGQTPRHHGLHREDAKYFCKTSPRGMGIAAIRDQMLSHHF